GVPLVKISMPALAVVVACFFWGFDNNFTRDVDELSPTVLAGTKGLAAGIFNILFALILGIGNFKASQVNGALIIGALSYGASLVLFIRALRLIGASRTSTYFASGPLF